MGAAAALLRLVFGKPYVKQLLVLTLNSLLSFPESGQLVVDPFCGGGQVPAACKALGRRWLAKEEDRATALVARKRVGECRLGRDGGGR